MYIYNNIRDELKSNPVCFIYKINQNNDFVLINKANSKRESKEILKNVSLTTQNVKITLMIILAWEITTFWSSSRSKLFQGLN